MNRKEHPCFQHDWSWNALLDHALLVRITVSHITQDAGASDHQSVNAMRRSIQHLPMDTAAVPVDSGGTQKVPRLMHAQDGVASLLPSAPVLCSGVGSEQEPTISAETCRSQLGDRTFNILRQAMLQQQETFIEQLWDLHKLTRAQHRKAALLPASPCVAAERAEATNDVFSRDVQAQKRSLTMPVSYTHLTLPTKA